MRAHRADKRLRHGCGCYLLERAILMDACDGRSQRRIVNSMWIDCATYMDRKSRRLEGSVVVAELV